MSLDKDSCKKRRMERMEVMRQKRQRSGSCADSLSSVSYSSADSVSTVSTIYLTKDEIRRKKNRESAERSRLRKLRLIDNLASQVTALREKQAVLKRENAALRAASATPPPSSALTGTAKKGRITLSSPDALDAELDNYLEDRSDASSLSSSSNSPYHAASFPACSLGLPPRCLPSTALRIAGALRASSSSVGGGGASLSDQQLLSFFGTEVSPIIGAANVECAFEELFDFKDLCDFDFAGMENISA